ncbi:MAG: class I SAM-dependent methyltransferase [Planctomycetales bacterium]|nr:class I SAM-dependent methyltransferase [Planctomycetales bacterium]
MDAQTLFTLMFDLYRDGGRQGPGGETETRRALELTRLRVTDALRVADIGCGTGASTLVLANQLPCSQITAVDLFPEFLEVLQHRADAAGCLKRIETRAESMDSLSFAAESLDLIWSEGAIYNIGFRKGLEAWRPFLKPGGVLAVSEITWLHPNPPEEILQHWNSEYPEIATAADKIGTLESAGYDLIGYFVLPASCWLSNYYEATEARISAFLARHADKPEATQVAEMERHESELYRRFQNWFSYGFYVTRRR